MDVQTLKTLLKRYETPALKKLGQHFLTNESVLNKIITASQIKPTEMILEIGCGIGNLTEKLAQKARKVIGVEKDQRLIPILKEVLKNYNNIKIIKGDILKIKIDSYFSGPYKVVANIPYYLTSHLIKKLLENPQPPYEIFLLVQKEVAQRICAKPPKMNLLAVAVQFYAKAKILFYVSKNSFWPIPRVDSAFLKIIPQPDKKKEIEFQNIFFKIVKAGFCSPRKQLINNFNSKLNLRKEEVQRWLAKNKINPKQRAETLSLTDWLNLTKTFSSRDWYLK